MEDIEERSNLVTAIIPAHNEGKTIFDIVNALRGCQYIKEVVVVDDGSTDDTAERASEAGARVIRQINAGQGSALARGVENVTTSFVMTCDADLLGLTSDDVANLVLPVISGEADMTVGLRDRFGLLMDLFPRLDPALAISGERVLRKEIFQAIPKELVKGYTTAMVISHYCHKKKLKVKLVKMKGVSQVIKEKKRGFKSGFLARLKMIWDHIYLRFCLMFKRW